MKIRSRFARRIVAPAAPARARFARGAGRIVSRAMQQAEPAAPAGYDAPLTAARHDGISGAIAFPVTTRQGAA
ncbi:hypothetical protein EFP18_26905 [Burkholderia glumae]|uniref:hypothetical protein n=1 Tax=Burkholderia glumae TaxID=337 RepID=UPI000C27BE54|nr:hypothetical protein [Burkholderia glumae]MCM2494993.1 hypothetical protein [Burkholderia glumae]MCM2545858.1 hypothetical protein [Burkholderia glumae]MCQ0030972.1 hypothetical protein [Burkholderia glumae]MCQ0037783.1 hypothetical protein [Burkholderia glumae]MCR1770970.1 hypothetical protein [Burkholderia glumae]